MKIEIQKEENLTILDLAGKYDIAEIKTFETSFKEEVVKKPKILALNLQKVAYIDSAGIGSLVRCMNIALKQNIDFLCFDLNPDIDKVFKLAKLDEFVKILSRDDFQDLYLNK